MSDSNTSSNVNLCVSAPTDNEVLAFIASNPDLCLQCLNDDGSIDLDGVKTIMGKTHKTRILENYIDDIKKLNGKNDKRYYIRLKDETRCDGRYTIKANTRDELLDKIYAWHIEHQRLINQSESTLASLHDEFLDHKKATTWSVSTVKKNESIWDNYYADSRIIHRKIREITLKELKEWAYGLIKDNNLTKKEFSNVCIWMKQILEYALQEEIIDRNPYQFLKITNQNVYRHTERKKSENLVLSAENEFTLYCKCWEYFESKHYPVHQLLPLAIISQLK